MNNNITGFYRHYKANEYEVIGEGLHTETEEHLVFYRSVSDPTQLWARPFDMFFDAVTVNGMKVPRFAKTER